MTDVMPPTTTEPPPSTTTDEATRKRASRGRMILVNAIIVVTTLLLVIGMFSVWANRLLFNPQNWSKTSTELLAHPAIRSATANYIVDQVYANVDVNGLIKSSLPTQLQGLAAPAAGALRNVAVKGADLALTRPHVQDLWAKANYAAAQQFKTIVEGGKGAVSTQNGTVTLNLASIIDDVASRLGLPPDVSSKLPPSIGTLTVLKSKQLKLVQDVGHAIQGLALALTIITPLLYALAIVLAPGRRRLALMTVGYAAVLAGVLVILGRSVLTSQGTNALTSDASLKPAVQAAFTINTEILGQIAGAVIAFGVVLVVAAWFGGPSRPARAARKAIAPFLSEHAAWTFAIVLAVMVLIFIWNPIHATGTPAGIITFTVLALFGAEVLRRETAREFATAAPGDATATSHADPGPTGGAGEETSVGARGGGEP